MTAMVTILDFYSEWFKLIFIYKSPLYFLPSFQAIGHSVQEKSSAKYIFKMVAMAAILDFR